MKKLHPLCQTYRNSFLEKKRKKENTLQSGTYKFIKTPRHITWRKRECLKRQRRYLVRIKFIRCPRGNLYSTQSQGTCIIGLSQRADRKQGNRVARFDNVHRVYACVRAYARVYLCANACHVIFSSRIANCNKR